MPGERVIEPRPVVTRLAARDRDIARKDPVSQHREPVTYKTRRLQPRVEAEPNAPQLIRLVRTPFELEKGYFKRISMGERAKLEPRERLNVAAELQQAREAGRRVPFPKPTECHPPITRPARLPLDRWLLGDSSGGSR